MCSSVKSSSTEVSGWIGKPSGITFSDGSEKTYCVVLYLRWNTDQGIYVRLVESKAKLIPLDHKGDAVKAEIRCAVFAVRLRKHFEKHGRMEVERWFHLVDSQTVLGAIQRDSYGYQTFFANRVGEIQKSGSVSDWWWIPGDINIADIITRGGALLKILLKSLNGRRDHDSSDIQWRNGQRNQLPRLLVVPRKKLINFKGRHFQQF